MIALTTADRLAKPFTATSMEMLRAVDAALRVTGLSMQTQIFFEYCLIKHFISVINGWGIRKDFYHFIDFFVASEKTSFDTIIISYNFCGANFVGENCCVVCGF